MKKILIFVSIIAGVLEVIAAPTSFTVEMPSWTKLAMARDPEGINIRKFPSVSAPRLICDQAKIEYFDIPMNYYATWSSVAPGGSRTAVKFIGPDPIQSEKNGWYEIESIGPKLEENGWVSAKYCNVITPTPIVFSKSTEKEHFRWLKKSAVNTGEYAIYAYLDEMNGEITFYFGRLKNGIVICPYILNCSAERNDDRKCGFISDGNYISFSYNSTILVDDLDIDISKLSDATLNEIVKYAKKNHDGNIVIYQHNGAYYIAAF